MTAMTAVTAPVAKLSHRQVMIVFGGLMLGMLLASLDQTIVATALPTIVGDLGGLDHLSWVVTAYLLTTTASTPLYGKISDLYGNFPPPLAAGDGFGSSVAYLGDLDGPGASVAALAVGATGREEGGTDRGAVYNLFLDGTMVTGVSPVAPPTHGALGRAWPNPLQPGTTIPFRLSQEAEVRIAVWDLHGRQVRQLVHARMPAGEHQVVWDGRDDDGRGLPTGTYFFRMALDGRLASGTGKALLLR